MAIRGVEEAIKKNSLKKKVVVVVLYYIQTLKTSFKKIYSIRV